MFAGLPLPVEEVDEREEYGSDNTVDAFTACKSNKQDALAACAG